MSHPLYWAVAEILPILLRTKSKQRISILTYHRIMPEYDYMRALEPTVAEFEWQMELLSAYFNPISLSQALDMAAAGKLPPRAVCVTFDDGYADNEELALPVLKRYKVPATVFVSTGYLNGGCMWNDTIIESVRLASGSTLDLRAIGLDEYSIRNISDRQNTAGTILNEIKHWPQGRRARAVEAIGAVEMEGVLPSGSMMTDKQLLNMSDEGVEIGAHTITHPILATLAVAEAEAEIVGSKQYLEKKLGKVVRSFAYPNGRPDVDYTQEHCGLVEASGFELAVSTKWGVASPNSDRWQLPRFTPWDKTPLRFMVRLLLNFRNSA